ncbi:MAG TPA: hypothetical protein DCR87_02600 [Acidobacteria bacterium]|nr:hypothetical protein [Acidobacteriota bacterium]
MGQVFVEETVPGSLNCLATGEWEGCGSENIKLARKFRPGLCGSNWPAGFLPAMVFYLSLG